MASLRARLLVGTMAGCLAVLSVAGGGLYVTLRRLLQADFNQSLAAKARTLAAMVEQDGDKTELELDYRTMREFAGGSDCEYYELWRSDGTAVQRSPSLAEADLDRIPADEASEVFRLVRLPDGRPGRLVGVTFRPRNASEDEKPGLGGRSEHPLVLVIARETRALDRTLSRIAVLMLAVGAGAVLLCAGVLSVVVQRGLRPLDRLAAEIHDIGENLSTRIQLPGAPAELLPVAERLNELLQRLEAAFLREKRFSADVAHELRTPLAGLRSTLEVCLSRPREQAAYVPVSQDCLAITGQMQCMVDNLLSLARMDAGQIEIQPHDVDLVELVRECWRPLAERANQRDLRVHWQAQGRCPVYTDPAKLRQVVHNLLDNAVTYVNASGEIRIELAQDEATAVLRVANSGSALSQAEAEHVFERFWRGDSSRHAGDPTSHRAPTPQNHLAWGPAGVHCGLGLALAKEIMTALCGTISVRSDAGGEFGITLVLPGRQAQFRRTSGQATRERGLGARSIDRPGMRDMACGSAPPRP